MTFVKRIRVTQIREKGKEYGTTTGRPRRVGWLDLESVKFSCTVSGITNIAITKIDILSGLTEIKMCTGYKLNGKSVSYSSCGYQELFNLTPIYKTLPGWTENIDGIKLGALYLKSKNIGVEFNTPITKINFPYLEPILDFSYDNEINLKLIEEVNLSKEQIREKRISSFLEKWLDSRDLNPENISLDKKYGKIYSFNNNFYFRIAPATKGLVDYLNKESTKILYDGRYWIGGNKGLFLFSPSCFVEPSIGNFERLRLNLNKTKTIYTQHDKK